MTTFTPTRIDFFIQGTEPALADPISCPCGAEYDEEMEFCPRCGRCNPTKYEEPDDDSKD